ncbi:MULTISPECIES: FeoC-like transcriptional regulator [Methylomonas]|uniref:FeoC-like transcriptional regulator n=1 Tax=Methylomonas TaxID=416 RepID=UPI001232953D|nr:FeoC-like transcriptional regulator [Methylomonas rhizoryzae]
MILSDLRNYLQDKRRVSLNDLVLRFGVDADAIRGMLGKWINKGKVRLSPTQSNCGSSCCKCDPLLTEIYEWVDDGSK